MCPLADKVTVADIDATPFSVSFPEAVNVAIPDAVPTPLHIATEDADIEPTPEILAEPRIGKPNVIAVTVAEPVIVAVPMVTPEVDADKVATPDIVATPVEVIGAGIADTDATPDIEAVLVTGNPLVTAVTVATADITATPRCTEVPNVLKGDAEKLLIPNIHDS